MPSCGMAGIGIGEANDRVPKLTTPYGFFKQCMHTCCARIKPQPCPHQQTAFLRMRLAPIAHHPELRMSYRRTRGAVPV